MGSERALLLIADIGGYTAYMRTHRMSLAHAEVNIARMLEAVIDAAGDFELIEIEGDATFLSRRADSLDAAATAESSPGPSPACTERSIASASTSSPTSVHATPASRPTT
jgi:hypothetical protein